MVRHGNLNYWQAPLKSYFTKVNFACVMWDICLLNSACPENHRRLIIFILLRSVFKPLVSNMNIYLVLIIYNYLSCFSPEKQNIITYA